MKRRFSLLVLVILFSLGVLAECDSDQIDINSASLAELDEITWVGEATATKIIDSRPFDSLDDLTKVSGIGETKLSDIKGEGLACVDEEGEEEESIIETEDEKEILSEEPIRENEEILLNEIEGKNLEVVYESKEHFILRLSPYLLIILFLIIVFWIIISRN